MKSKKSRILIVLTTLCLTLFGTVMSSAKASMFDSGYVNTCVSDGSNDNKTESGSNPTTSGATGAWTQQGSQAYNNAKKVFDFWAGKGFSGASAAAVTGNVGTESMHEFDPTIVQGGGHSNDPASAGNAGYGLYQFTPGAKLKQIPGYTGPTVDNENDCMWNGYQGASISNGVKNYSGLKDLGGGDDINKATELWEQKVEAAGIPNMADRISGAQKAYSMFGGSNIKANSALLAGAGTAAGTSNNGGVSQSDSGNKSPDCSNGSSGSDNGQADGDIVKIARSMMGWFHYPNPDRHNVQMVTKDGKLNSKDDLNKDGQTDCSGFVWIVLKLAGYSVPPAMGWYTKTMAEDAKGPHKWFKQIDPKDAKPGDVIIVNEGDGAGANGHTAIITSNWQGYDNTKCINEGGDDQTVFHNDGVSEDTIQRQFGSMLQTGDVTIAEPVKASNSK